MTGFEGTAAQEQNCAVVFGNIFDCRIPVILHWMGLLEGWRDSIPVDGGVRRSRRVFKQYEDESLLILCLIRGLLGVRYSQLHRVSTTNADECGS